MCCICICMYTSPSPRCINRVDMVQYNLNPVSFCYCFCFKEEEKRFSNGILRRCRILCDSTENYWWWAYCQFQLWEHRFTHVGCITTNSTCDKIGYYTVQEQKEDPMSISPFVNDEPCLRLFVGMAVHLLVYSW